MNITAEKTSTLENKLIVDIEPADYASRFDEAIKTYRKKVNMPGFRQGMVPMGMVKKMYGKALLYEELNKLIQESLDNYMKEEKLEIFAQPMPEEENDPFADGMESDKAFRFSFNIGLKPAVDTTIPSKTFIKHQVEPSAELLENYIKDLRTRHFEGAYPEKSEAGDMVFLRIRELNEAGELKEGGLVTVSLVKLADIADAALQAELTGIGKDYSTRTGLETIFGTDKAKIAAGIKKTEAELAEIGNEVEVTVSNVMREGLAELNETFFGKVFGSEDIKTEADFTDRVKLELGRSIQAEAEQYLRSQIMEAFFEQAQFELPDDFLKRWLVSNAKEEVKQAELEAQYPDYAKQLRRDLLIDKVLADAGMEIQADDLINEAKGQLYRQFSSYGIPLDDEMLQKYAMDYLQKDDNYSNVFYSVKYRKVEAHLRDQVKVDEKALSFEDFEKLTKEKTV